MLPTYPYIGWEGLRKGAREIGVFGDAGGAAFAAFPHRGIFRSFFPNILPTTPILAPISNFKPVIGLLMKFLCRSLKRVFRSVGCFI